MPASGVFVEVFLSGFGGFVGNGVARAWAPCVAGLGEFAGASADDSAAVAVHAAVDFVFVGREVHSALGVAASALDLCWRVSFGADGCGVGGVGEEEGAGEYDRGDQNTNLQWKTPSL